MFKGTIRFFWSSEDRDSAVRGANSSRLAIGSILSSLVLAAVMMHGATQASAQQYYSDDQPQKPLPEGVSHAIGEGPPEERLYTPFYDKASGSYFQLATSRRTLNWEAAKLEAANRTYEGRQGRLAIIKSPKTQFTLMKNLNVDIGQNDPWIGLEYLCAAKQLVWADGTVYQPGQFANWGPQWTRSDFGEQCNEGYMGVTLAPGDNFKWLAYGTGKGMAWYIVEYPAPAKKKTEANASDSDAATQ